MTEDAMALGTKILAARAEYDALTAKLNDWLDARSNAEQQFNVTQDAINRQRNVLGALAHGYDLSTA